MRSIGLLPQKSTFLGTQRERYNLLSKSLSNSVDIHVLMENTPWDIFLEQGAESRPIDLIE